MVNLSVLFGILAAAAMMIVTLAMSNLNSAILLNVHATVVVLGGTFAASLLCFSFSSFAKMTKVLFKKVIFGQGITAEAVISEVTDLARGYRLEDDYLRTRLPALKTPFLIEAVEMINKGVVSPERLARILRKRSQYLSQRYGEESQIFKVIAKFPPAFGLMGTTLGMIGLMQSMGSEDAIHHIGPTMGVALIATFYGIALANLLFIPMGEHLAKLNRHDALLRKIVIEGILMVIEKQHHVIVAEDLKSYLLPGARAKLRDLDRPSENKAA